MSDAANSPRPRREPEFESDVVDLTSIPLLDLINSDAPAVVDSLQRLIAELDDRQETLASWGNFVQ
jgi:hypothetical protein